MENLSRRSFLNALNGFVLIFTLSYFPASLGQGIFSELEFEENYVRARISQHTLSVSSLDTPSAIPSNIIYQLVFTQILADPQWLSQMSSPDADLVLELPAHEDKRFIERDNLALSALCSTLEGSAQSTSDITEAAISFDSARLQREQDLDAHYSEVVAHLSEPSKEIVFSFFEKISQSTHMSHLTFDMSGLAADEPQIAKAILLNGCDNFHALSATHTPESVFLRDRIYLEPPA